MSPALAFSVQGSRGLRNPVQLDALCRRFEEILRSEEARIRDARSAGVDVSWLEFRWVALLRAYERLSSALICRRMAAE